MMFKIVGTDFEKRFFLIFSLVFEKISILEISTTPPPPPVVAPTGGGRGFCSISMEIEPSRGSDGVSGTAGAPESQQMSILSTAGT